MFFESFMAVLTTLLNSKTPFYSLVFSFRSIQTSSSKKKNVHLILQFVSKASDVIKMYWTLCGFNFKASFSLWRPPRALVGAGTQRYLSAVSYITYGTQIALRRSPNQGPWRPNRGQGGLNALFRLILST